MKNKFTKTFRSLRIILCAVVLLASSGFLDIDFTVPVINSASVDNISGTGFRLTVNVVQSGTRVYWVVTTSSTQPTTTQIKDGETETGANAIDDGSINIGGGDAGNDVNTGTAISGLSSETQYYIHFFAEENSSSDQSSVQTLGALTDDVTDPAVTVAKGVENTGTSFTFKINVNDEGTVYYIVDKNPTPPTKAQIILHDDAGDNTAEAWGTIPVTAGVEAEALVTGLTYSLTNEYYVYYFVRDEAGNESNVESRGIPILENSSIPGAGIDATELDLRVSINEKPVTVYYVVTTTSTEPTSSQIFSETDAADGTPVASGNFNYNPGSAGDDVNHTITGLDDNTTYYVHFFGADGSGNETIVETESATTDDATPPQVVTFSPADDGVMDFTNQTFTITFDENIDNVNFGSFDDTDRVLLFEEGNATAVEEIDRTDTNAGDGDGTISADGTSPVATITFLYAFKPNTNYHIRVGEDVFEDNAGNDFDGFSTSGTWNFSTSGVVVNNVTSNICPGSFQSIADIVISEGGAGDFMTSGSVWLEFEDTDFAYDISGVSVSAGAGDTDITSVTLDPTTLTRLTLNFTLSGTDEIDVITISGLKIYTSAPGASVTTITNGNSPAGKWAINDPITFATIQVGSSVPAAPQLETAPASLLYCQNEPIDAEIVSVVNDTGIFKWFADASLSDYLGDGEDVAVEALLDIDASVVGTVKRYVVHVDGCQSAPLEVTFTVAPIPVADAGPPTNVCSGSSITIGGSPTLTGPSVAGAYQYLWSHESPANFIDLGSNPTVSPTHDRDTTFTYTVMIVDANGCTSNILDPNATIAIAVDSTDEVIVYNSPLSTSFTLNANPIELDATPSFNSTYSGNGVYLANGTYYFDPDLAGTTGSPHIITYTTDLSNGCPKTETRSFTVSSASGTIENLASSYCENEAAMPSEVLELGMAWSNNLNANNASTAPLGYTYEFFDFQTYLGTQTPGTGVVGGNVLNGVPQYINPATLQAFNGTNAYIGMRVRQKTENTLLGIPLGTYTYGSPFFYNYQHINFYRMPALKVTGLRSNDVICDVDQEYNLEANNTEGIFEISRNGTDYFSGPNAGITDSPPNSGKAIFNPHEAYTSNEFGPPSSGITDFFIRYTYSVPGTSGSDNSICEATLVIPFKISPNPPVAWTPFTETEFCFEAANYVVKTNTANPSHGAQFDTITGYGIFDNGDGTASFDPDKGLAAKAFGTNSPPYTDYNAPQDIIISAKRTDANGCHTTINQTVAVRPLFPATFTVSDLDLCYEDAPQDIIGDQPNGYYVLQHPDLPDQNFAQTTIANFNLRTYFDQAVAAGADGTVSQKFNLTFNTSDPVLECSNSVTKVLTISPAYELDIIGMTPDMIVCGNAAVLNLEGSKQAAGAFEISTSENSGFTSNAFGLSNTTAGKATFTPANAGIPAGDPQQSFYIRYSFQGAGCTGFARTTERLVINPQPTISFASDIPAANAEYCFEQGNSPTTIVLTTDEDSNVTVSGLGITDNGGGDAIFNPTNAYQQSSLNANANPLTDQTKRNILITATRTDAEGCSNTDVVNYWVNPRPVAAFTPQTDYCYEDDAEILSGAQGNVTYQYVYKNTTTPPAYTTAVISGPSTTFDPSVFFDDAVSKGANELATLQFDVIYTSISSTTGCTNQLPPVPLKVAPYLPGQMAGINDGDIYCSNETDKEIVFTPANGIFKIDGGSAITLNAGKYVFDPPIALPEGGKEYVFTYEVTTGSNCTNTQTKVVRVLPSPRALFSVDAMCNNALIPYNADPSTNLPSASYTWNLAGEAKTGQNIEHTFPGVSTYSVQLVVRHPPYIAADNLVCSDSVRYDQIVGPYPDIDFSFFNVCEEEETNFEVITKNIPISTASWNFGDGETTSLGTLSDMIPALPRTSGTYQNPIHAYDGAADHITVSVVGKTSLDFGGCETTFEREISILKKWAPTPDALSYDMSQIDDGKGFWVVEDSKGNASWEFNTAAKQRINTAEKVWVTGPTSPYNADDVSYVNSPCFDLTTFTRPVVSIKHWTDTEPSDGAVFQYSTDGGENWHRLGDVASGLDWYNRLTISSNPGQQTDLSSGWSLSDQVDWAIGKHTLDVLPTTPRNQVRFRVAFSSFNNRENRDGFAFNNIVIEERNRTILVENFTNLGVTEGSTVNNNAYKAFKTIGGAFNPNELVKLQYHHASAGASDELNQDNPVDQNARAAFYGVTEPLRAFVDGGFGQVPTDFTFTSGPLIDTYFNLRSLVSSPINISIDFDEEPADKLNVRATIQAITAIPQTVPYNIFIAIAEKDVQGQAYVLRKFLPSAAGTPLMSFSETDAAQEIVATYDMRHVTRLPNGEFAPIAVIVFVQNLETKDVLQTAMRQDASPASGIVTGAETTPDNYIKVYPNPADDVLNVILPTPVTYETPLKLFDSFGKQVFEDLFKPGESVKTIEAKGLSSGVYLLQLSTPEGSVRKKTVIAHE